MMIIASTNPAACAGKLSDRVRPGSEAAPWVTKSIEELETIHLGFLTTLANQAKEIERFNVRMANLECRLREEIAEKDRLNRQVQLMHDNGLGESWVDRVAEKDAEIERLKADYLTAAELVASMHEAAMGGVIGPVRGVVEDVEDLRTASTEKDRRIAELEKENKRLDSDKCYTHAANVEFMKRIAELEDAAKHSSNPQAIVQDAEAARDKMAAEITHLCMTVVPELETKLAEKEKELEGFRAQRSCDLCLYRGYSEMDPICSHCWGHKLHPNWKEAKQ